MSSYNCNSIRTAESMKVVTELCRVNDIICLQEHMLPKQDLAYLQKVHPDFYGMGTSPVDLQTGPLLDRRSGYSL